MFSDTRIDGITLFESETKSSGSVYRELAKIDVQTDRKAAGGASKRQTRERLELGDESRSTRVSTPTMAWPRGSDH